jgi:uronate dehydrogenase
LTSNSFKFEVVHGVSNCPQALLRNETAKRLGYSPQDSAAENHAPEFRPLSSLSEKDGIGYVGGFFAVTDLPDATETKWKS